MLGSSVAKSSSSSMSPLQLQLQLSSRPLHTSVAPDHTSALKSLQSSAQAISPSPSWFASDVVAVLIAACVVANADVHVVAHAVQIEVTGQAIVAVVGDAVVVNVHRVVAHADVVAVAHAVFVGVVGGVQGTRIAAVGHAVAVEVRHVVAAVAHIAGIGHTVFIEVGDVVAVFAGSQASGSRSPSRSSASSVPWHRSHVSGMPSS